MFATQTLSVVFCWYLGGYSIPAIGSYDEKYTQRGHGFSPCPLILLLERLLNEHFLNLAVSRANNVQTLLELRQLNTINREECCCALSYGCSVDAGF